MQKTVGTSVRFTPERMTKLEQLAAMLSVSRNEAMGLLIEAAQVVTRPSISVMVADTSSEGNATHAQLY